MRLIPTLTDGTARYSVETELDGVNYVFSFEWNDRLGSWFFDVADADKVPLISGVRVVVGFPLLNRYRDPRLPAGIIEAIDTSGAAVDPGLYDLGDRVAFAYTEVAEIPAALVYG